MTFGPCRFTNAVGGTADFTYPGPAIDMQSPAAAGVLDGGMYLYYAQSLDMTQWESGLSTYTASSGVFARTTVQSNHLGTTALVNFLNPPQAFFLQISSTGRVTLNRNADYYVDGTNGSDANDGLAAGVGRAFKTIQHAIDVCVTLDFGGFSGTVHVASGTYTAGLTLSTPFLGGSVNLVGDTTTPGNVVIQPASPQNAFNVDGIGSQISIAGFKFLTSGGGVGVYATNGGHITIGGKIEFGACTTQIAAASTGIVSIANGVVYAISGGGSNHMSVSGGGRIIANLNTVTVSGTPAFSVSFVSVTDNGLIEQLGTTYSGSATGVRYGAVNGGGIQTSGGGATFYPGNSAGVATSPGWYA